MMGKKILLAVIFALICDLAYGAAATMYVTAAGAGNKDGTEWAHAFGYSEWETDWENNVEAGDTYYVEEGTYTLTSDFSQSTNGTSTSPIKVIGVVSGTSNEPPVYSDWAYGNDRPLIAGGGYSFQSGGNTGIYNLRGTTTSAEGFSTDSSKLVYYNCKAENTRAAADGYAIKTTGGFCSYVFCEAASTNGIALGATTGENKFVYNYVHDSDVGIQALLQCLAYGNIVDTCTTTGIDFGDVIGYAINNTIYNCGKGIYLDNAAPAQFVFMNNIIDACTTGAQSDNASAFLYFDYNCWDNTTDTSGVSKGNNAVTGDPGMTDPGSGDFTLGSGSNCRDAGACISTNEGVTGDYKWNIGADQDDVAAAAAASIRNIILNIM